MAASGRANGHDLGPEAFVHLDVVSAFSRLQSPATPRDYVSALAQQFPLNERTVTESRPALSRTDTGRNICAGARVPGTGYKCRQSRALAPINSSSRVTSGAY